MKACICKCSVSRIVNKDWRRVARLVPVDGVGDGGGEGGGGIDVDMTQCAWRGADSTTSTGSVCVNDRVS